MNLCKYAYQHINAYTNICMHIHAYIHACVHTCMHACMHACMHTYIHIHTYTYIHIPICIHACMQTDSGQTDTHTDSGQTDTHKCTYTTYIYIHIILYMCTVYIYDCGSKPASSRGSPPLLQTFVAGPLLQTLVADLCVEYCSLQEASRGGVCRRTPLSVTNLCREMAAQACYKANVFDSLPYMYICICMYASTGLKFGIWRACMSTTCVHIDLQQCSC